MIDVEQWLRQVCDLEFIFARVVILEGPVCFWRWEWARWREIVANFSHVEVLGLVGIAVRRHNNCIFKRALIKHEFLAACMCFLGLSG